MKFFYHLQTIDKAGRQSSSTSEFDSQTITVGRGGKSDIILSDELLAYEHIKFFERNKKLHVQDISPFHDLRVNGQGVTKSRLSEGDLVQFGTVSMTVEKRGSDWGLSYRKEEHDRAELKEELQRQVKSLNVNKVLPSLYLLSTLFGLLVVAAVYVPGLLFNTVRQIHAPGKMSRPHSLVANDCESCHEVHFTAINDGRCLSCHNLSAHGGDTTSVSHTEPSCVSCHTEHRGLEGPINDVDEKQCIACHEVMKTEHPDSMFRNVSSLASHPKIKVNGAPDPITGEVSRFLLSQSEEARDPGTIKFNHAKHLEPGLKAPDGPVDMTCRDCHQLTDDLKSMKAIEFNRDCRTCHSLGFDPRLPDREVPHEDPDIVFDALLSDYTLLYLRDEQTSQKPEEFVLRRKPGFTPGAEIEEHSDFARKNIVADARKAETDLFLRKGCELCHQIDIRKDASEEESEYRVAKPNMPDDWLPYLQFDHGAHEEVTCESCHKGVAESGKAAEVLLPDIDVCRDCHFEKEKHGYVQTTCMTCHAYHHSEPMKLDKKIDLKDLMMSVHRFGNH